MITPTQYQRRVLQIPETWSVMLAGGRGGGKTYAMVLRIVRHLVKYGPAAKVLIVRENYKGLQAIEELLGMLLPLAFPGRVKANRQEHIFRILDGGSVECGQIESFRDVSKYQGRETTMLCVDEAGTLKEWRFVNLLKSNLRTPADVPLSVVMTANPGSNQHAHIYSNFIAAGLPFHPITVDGETWVVCPSTMRDNPHLDHDDYQRRLKSACGNDEALYNAWCSGDWSCLNRGAFFGLDWSPERHILPVELPFEITPRWQPSIALDYGSSAPCVTLFCATSPGDVPGIPKGTCVVFDEVAAYDRRDPSLNTGLNWPISKVAESIVETAARWNIKQIRGVGDDAQGFRDSNDSLLKYLRDDHQIHLNKPTKGRVQGWSLIRNRLQATKNRTGKPGLLISQRAGYLLQTLPICMRDENRPEDLDTSGPDHGLDALRYHCNTQPSFFKVSRRAGHGSKMPSGRLDARPLRLTDAQLRGHEANVAIDNLRRGNF